jgi:hypothetical protein
MKKTGFEKTRKIGANANIRAAPEKKQKKRNV